MTPSGPHTQYVRMYMVVSKYTHTERALFGAVSVWCRYAYVLDKSMRVCVEKRDSISGEKEVGK